MYMCVCWVKSPLEMSIAPSICPAPTGPLLS